MANLEYETSFSPLRIPNLQSTFLTCHNMISFFKSNTLISYLLFSDFEFFLYSIQ